MFQFPGFPSLHYGFMQRYCNITCSEFPHSDICGSRLICSSPQLFAACHVLLRRHVPRHPPYALCSLIFLSSTYPYILTKFFDFNSAKPRNSGLSACLAFLRFRINQFGFLFVFCLSYFASFSTMQLSIFGILSKERGCRNRQPKYNIMFILVCQAFFNSFRLFLSTFFADHIAVSPR